MLRLGNSSRSKKWTSLEVERLEERALLSSFALVGSPAAFGGVQADATGNRLSSTRVLVAAVVWQSVHFATSFK